MTKISTRSIVGLVRSFLGLAFLIAIAVGAFGLHLWYWQQIDVAGKTITCTVDRKDERIDRQAHGDSWRTIFHVTLRCPWTEAGAPNDPTFDTDEAEFDRLQRGAPFEVRYLHVPIGWQLLGAPASHLKRETLDVHLQKTIAWFAPIFPILAYIACVGVLIAIVSKSKSKTRVPGVRWALIALLGIGLIWALTPTLPVTLSGPTASATATVKELHAFTRILESRRSRGYQATTPYELVVLEFTPPGRRDPVLAADMIDIASHKPLAIGQQVPIDYEAAHPRRANIQQATRFYYWQNVQGAFIDGFVVMAFLIGGSLLWTYVKKRAKQALIDAQERARDRAL